MLAELIFAAAFVPMACAAGARRRCAPAVVAATLVAAWTCAAAAPLAADAARPGPTTRDLASGSITGQVVEQETGRPIPWVDIFVPGTALRASTDRGGTFVLSGIPPGTHPLRVTRVGYQPRNIPAVQVQAGKPTSLRIPLQRSPEKVLPPVVVVRSPKATDVRTSTTGTLRTKEELFVKPVDEARDLVGINVGVVNSGGVMHIRGARGDELAVRIDGVPANDPLSGSSVPLGLLSVAEFELLTGGMDAEYGNATSVLNYVTRSGGRIFEGTLRYTTDDYGRADKTFTNYDRVAVGCGGPTPFEGLDWYASGEATFQDGEYTTVKEYRDHRSLGGLLHLRERASSDYRLQARVDWKLRHDFRMTWETTLDRSTSDPYLHNWNTEGRVARVVVMPEVRRNRSQPDFFVLNAGPVTVYDGPWRRRAQQAIYVDVRQEPGCTHCLLPLSDNTTVRGVRVVDLQGRGSDRARPLYVLADQVLFEGWQNPASTWSPEASGTPEDSSRTAYNAADHTLTNRSLSRQIKWSCTQTLSPRTFWELKLSQLRFGLSSSVDGKTPGEFASAGKMVWIPGRGPQVMGTPEYYTDPAFPFFVTAYDDPAYTRRDSDAWLLKTDLSTQRWSNHKVKTGLLLQYNDLEQAQIASPGRQRGFRDPYGYSRNVFHTFNPEGSVYLQDRWEHEGMVVNAGLRYDFFSPGSGVGIEVHNDQIRRDLDRWETQWSPRLGLAFPITDRDVFHFHYGRFIQFPSKAQVFASQDVNAGVGTLGNPNLDPETSVSYQAGIKHQFTNEISSQVALFDKNYYGLVSSTEVTDDSSGTQRFRYVNRSYASSRGVELQLDRSFSRGFAFELAYTWSFADGVASDADFGRRAQGLSHLPTGELPLDWDQRHTFNATVTVARAGDWSVTTLYQYGSGLPWTPYFRFQKKQDPQLENSRRFPATHGIDLRGEKYFRMHGHDLRLFVDGRNLLDRDVVADATPAVFPALRNATEAYLAYATETGRFGGAYLQDTDGDGRDEFFPLHDPRVYGSHRLFRLGLGLEF